MYTEITEEQKENYNSKFKVENFKMSFARSDPSAFAYFMLGIKPFVYQDIILNDPGRRIAVCSSRQIGKTLTVSLKALHAALMNENFRVVVVSPSLDQSRKVLQGMRDLIYKGDKHMKTFNKRYVGFFSSRIDKEKPNTTTELNFKNGSSIKSVPATETARGNTADLVLCDEAAFMDDEIFEKIIEPMIFYTNGKIILSSTPNGTQGFFYKHFDPDAKLTKEEKEYFTYWFPWNYCPNEGMRSIIETKKKNLDKFTFEQEYEAKFTTSTKSFFENEVVEEHATLMEKYSCNTPCFVGVDWGFKTCKTAITVGTKNVDKNQFELLFIYEFDAGEDNRKVLDFLEQLEKDYNIDLIVSDDCPLSDSINRDIEEAGHPLKRFSFLKEKRRAYHGFREALNEGKIKYPKNRHLLEEMKSLRYERTPAGQEKIEKPQTGSDDIIDSFVMCYSPMIDDETNNQLLLV